MLAAHNGQNLLNNGEIVGHVSAAELRATYLRAARRHEARIVAGHDDEESVEAEAGAILEAEAQCDMHDLREMFKAWLEAQK